MIEITAISAVVLGGAGLRFFKLGFQSLWFDELFSVIFSRSGRTVAEIFTTYTQDVFDHPIGYPLMLHFWLMVFGDNDLAARSLSVLWGVVGIAVIFFLGRRIGGTALGLTAALLTAVNAYHIAYSQEARSYALVFVFAALAYASMVALVEKPNWWAALAFGTAVAVAVHIHYYALVMFCGQVAAVAGALVLRRARWRDWRPFLASIAVVAASLTPWIGPLVRVGEIDRYWSKVPRPFFFAEYFHAYFGKNLVLSIGFGFLLLALPLLLRNRSRFHDPDAKHLLRRAAAVLALAVAVSLAVAYGRSILTVPMLIARFTFVFLPAVLLLIAMAASLIRPRWVQWGVVSSLVAVSLANLVISGYYSKPRKEQWREAVSWVLTDPRFDWEADRCLAVYAMGFQYYADRQRPGLRFEEATTEAMDDLLALRPTPPVLWLLTARGIQPPEDFKILQRKHWVRTDRVKFIRIQAERWEPRPPPLDAEER